MDSHDRKARRATLSLFAIGAVAVAALVTGGITAIVVLDDDAATPPTAGPSAPASPSPPSTGAKSPMTPEKAKKVSLVAPTGQKDGASTGFPHSVPGAISAAVYFWEEYAFLDDQQARRQLEAVTSPDATGYIDEQISEVRKLREGAGLPPSGPAPAGVTFTTTVEAVRVTSVDVPGMPLGDVVQVWMHYDRYATGPDGGADDNPLKDETDGLFLKWQDGAWKLTNEPDVVKRGSFPVAYFPESPHAWGDGWKQVKRAD